MIPLPKLPGTPPCAEVDPDLWFPAEGRQSPAARNICAACPVQVECLTFAQENREEHGIWGGLNQSERQRLRNAR